MIKVYTIKGKNIFHVFKNGRSSVMAYSKDNYIRPLINAQINRVDTVTMYLRDPKERFTTGVHSFIEFEKRKTEVDYDTALHFIASHGLTNEHFEPQFNWVKRLATHFEGNLELLSVSDLLLHINYRNRPGIPEITQEQRNKINKIQPRHTVDELLMEHIGSVLPIRSIIARVNDALS